MLGAAMNADQLAQHLDHASRADAARHIDRQALVCELIDHRRTLQLLPVGAGIEHEVIRPHLAHGRCGQRPWAASRYAPPRPLSGYLQPMQTPDAVGALRAPCMTPAAPKNPEAP